VAAPTPDAPAADDTPQPETRASRRAQAEQERVRHHYVRNALAALLVVVLGVTGYVGYQLWSFNRNVTRSDAITGVPEDATASVQAGAKGDVNILVMGLDSRLDINGKPLSDEVYEALHAGDETHVSMNSNVIMVFHIPGDGSKASAVSIPRDDYVPLAGCPLKRCEGKIKQAYGFAFEQEQEKLTQQGGLSPDEIHSRSREAGRRAQIATVQNVLGVKIDHFVEVTMAAFYQIAQVIEPITVCVKEDTADTFSGADFKAGQQDISARQAVAFVRQRRDTNHPMALLFTDLDRARRQQAFIISVLYKLKSAQTLTNPAKVKGILDVAAQNSAIDSGLDALSFLGTARDMAGGNLSFYTLPVEGFARNQYGEDINVVDLGKIRAMVQMIFKLPTAGPPATSGTPTSSSSPTTSKATSTSSKPARTTTTPTFTAQPGEGGGTSGPPVTALTELTSGGIPCVK